MAIVVEPETVYFNARIKFRKVSWDELTPEDVVYYKILSISGSRAHGPFTVVDPVTGRLKNCNGVEFGLPLSSVQPLVIVNEM